MRSRLLSSLAVLAVASALTACERGARGAREATATPTPAAEPGARQTSAGTYDIRGTVMSVAADRRSVSLDHEAIAGLMPAMKMDYPVKEPRILEGIQAGDMVQGRLEAKDGSYLLVSVEKRP
jgi:Cu/Ag efflux protein CusF